MKYQLIFSLLLVCLAQAVCAQKFLVLDKYGTKRIKLEEGAEIYFKQRENKAIFHDYIGTLKDSSIFLGSARLEMNLDEFEVFRFHRDKVMFVSHGSNFMAGGFLFAAAIHPLISNAQYDAQESAIIGASFFVLGQALKLLKWKKFKLKKNARIRILDTTFR